MYFPLIFDKQNYIQCSSIVVFTRSCKFTVQIRTRMFYIRIYATMIKVTRVGLIQGLKKKPRRKGQYPVNNHKTYYCSLLKQVRVHCLQEDKPHYITSCNLLS